MMIYPAVLTIMGELGLIITYKLLSLDVSIGESNFSDHGARLGAA
jgi:hypothetical protein